MKTLQRNKFLQILVGFASVILFLWSGRFLVNKIQLLKLPDVSPIEIGFCIIYPILFAVFIIGVSLISKRHSMGSLFYTVFGVSFISGAAAYIICLLEGSVSLLLWGIVLVPLGMPLGDISKGMEKLLEFPSEYSGDLYSYVYQWDFLVVFLGIAILSLIIYQSTVKTEKQKKNYIKWRLKSSTEKQAKIMIATFGFYAFISDIYFALPDCKVANWIWVFLVPIALVLTMTFIIYVLPIALCGTLVFKGIKQAKEEKNFRKIFNPYIIFAIVSTAAGCNSIFEVAITAF